MARSSKSAESVLDALGNPMRRRIVRLLITGPRTVGVIASKLPVSRPAVSKHLQVLERAKLVAVTRQGTQSVFRLERAGFEHARKWLELFWEEGLASFAQLAEEER